LGKGNPREVGNRRLGKQSLKSIYDFDNGGFSWATEDDEYSFRVRGMTQLGLLTGTGILLFLLCVMFLLPALIVFSERKEKRRAPKLFLHSFGSGKLIDLSIARPRVTIIAWCVFIVVCGLLATRLRFSDNIQDLRAKGNPGVVNQTRITEKFGQSFDFMMYVSEGKSMEEVLGR